MLIADPDYWSAVNSHVDPTKILPVQQLRICYIDHFFCTKHQQNDTSVPNDNYYCCILLYWDILSRCTRYYARTVPPGTTEFEKLGVS